MPKGLLFIIDRLEEIIGITMLVIMVVVLSLQVFSRYLFNAPLTWSEELARFLFVWVTFIGAGYGVKHRCHIDMEILVRKFPLKMQKYTKAFTNILAIACYAYIIPDSVEYTIYQHEILSTGLNLPMSYVLAAVPVGCSILVIRLVFDTIAIFRDKEVAEERVLVE